MKKIRARFLRYAAAALPLALLLALSGCGAPALPDVLKGKGVSGDAAASLRAEIRYLPESKGTNYMAAGVDGGSDAMKTLLECLLAGKPAQKPADAQYTPELRCDCQIVIVSAGGGAAEMYYDTKSNLLVCPEVTKGKDRDTVRYLYFTPDGKLGEWIAGQRQFAEFVEETDVKPFRNMEELKASIDPTELAEEGEELDFEFFSGATPEYAGTACSVYTTVDFAAVPEDSCLITAYGKSAAGEQQKLSVIGFETNTNYTKILVAGPDEALESVDTGDEAPDAYAILVKKAALGPGKWLVFVDDNDRVLDVILPEDIEGLREAAAAATPQPTEEADAIE